MELLREWRKQPGLYRWHFVSYRLFHMPLRNRGRGKPLLAREKLPVPCGYQGITTDGRKDIPPKGDICPECREYATRLIVERKCWVT